jgi:hypothetical protein
MIDSGHAAELPGYLQATAAMVRAAFPNGISDDDYRPLLVVLSEGMGQRALAHLMAALTGKPNPGVYNDVLGIQSPIDTDKPAPEHVAEVRQRLQQHGYDEWLAEED